MCETCGCDDHLDSSDRHHHGHGQHAHHEIINVERNVLEVNNRLALDNRKKFIERDISVINLLSSPGSGKTSLLIKTIQYFKNQYSIAVIEGDQQTDLDAQRISALDIPVKQINTGKGCHLDAHMVSHAVEDLGLDTHSMLFIENVGNLVCPALFDLGEAFKVMILSVTEGDDKPLKYPYMVRESQLMIINKIDLLPYVEFDVAQCIKYALSVNPALTIIQTSVTTHQGLDQWYEWLKTKMLVKSPSFVI
jgi:hydrogenase nickel incorporation protein HypB